jgi:hypothetical protein
MQSKMQTRPFVGGLELVFLSEVIDGELMDTKVILRQRGDIEGTTLCTIAGDVIEQFHSELLDTIERHRI